MAAKDIVMDYIVSSKDPVQVEDMVKDLQFNINQYKIQNYIDELQADSSIVEIELAGRKIWVPTVYGEHNNHEVPKPTISAGIVYHCTADNTVLLVHPTNQLYWDIPKGRVDDGETYEQTAIRELREETGISIDIESLSLRDRSGLYSFNKYKEICLFKHARGNKINAQDLVCTSYFDDHRGNRLPEIDAFAWVNKEDVYTYLPRQIHNVVRWCL